MTYRHNAEPRKSGRAEVPVIHISPTAPTSGRNWTGRGNNWLEAGAVISYSPVAE